jgi:shikimate kinase
MIITLVGYRGTGKSTIAAALAGRLGWTAFDADVEVERRAGRSIRDLFETGGEAAFRTVERQVMADLLAGHRHVIAAGGGAVLNADTRREMMSAGPVVLLRASLETVLARLAADASTRDRRPSLTGQDPRAEIQSLLAQRAPLYRDVATCIVDTDGRTPEDIVAEVWERLPAAIREGAA